ncbi:MerR family transcriptional regulator [Alicyclobacillus fastidiosus]|uniref:MerR family transcriptional regulator n=1 Tax=Alicyclobacillus fastidiosus TaxID=392011 RepID=A0ABY6ZF68_9BACL|nr:MerR family transcriptional regulator [Alicyclobacillus fastidiosus]WAH41491.1 MerR family transcriptional regulator [Alicyclobacillus fastidiosus]GMA63136.1 MerR family transcriptional regulator [Alicyclobacillus fastidiosus]
MTESELNGLTVEAVVRQLGVTPRTLRYYEEVGLITPTARTSGGHRLYDQSTIDRLEQILRLKENLGFSLQGIREILDAEQSLECLRQTFRQGGQTEDEQRSVVDRYIEVLGELIDKMDKKIESITAMRNMYQERLDRSIRFRDEKMPDR